MACVTVAVLDDQSMLDTCRFERFGNAQQVVCSRHAKHHRVRTRGHDATGAFTCCMDDLGGLETPGDIATDDDILCQGVGSLFGLSGLTVNVLKACEEDSDS